MRALLGLLVLGSLFVMAASWQNRTTAGIQDRRAQRYGIPDDSAAGTDGWSRLVLGRPSGADPIRLPEPVGPAPDPTPGPGTGGVTPPIEPPVTPIPRDFEYEVKPADVLGVICQRHYDVRPLAAVVEAVSRYNNLKSADDIRAGKILLLPDPAVLFPNR